MRRSPLALAALALLAMAYPSSAAPRHFLTDPSGDALVPLPAYDILSADLSTRSTTSVVRGKRVTRPTTLVASVTLAGAPTTPGLTVHVNDDLSSCGQSGFLTLYYQAPSVVPAGSYVSTLHQPPAQVSDCSGAGGGVAVSVEYAGKVTVKGSTITWEIPLAQFGSKMSVGTGLSGTEVVTYQDEPTTGAYTTDVVTGGVAAGIDTATAEKTFVIT